MTDAKFPEGRKLLALYPVFLFYLSLSWIVLIGFQQNFSRHDAETESPPETKGASNLSSLVTPVDSGNAVRYL